MSLLAPASDDIIVSARGPVPREARAYAHDKIARLRRFAPAPILFAKVDLLAETDPARDRPAVAEGELDVDGQLVRAKVAAGTLYEAIDLLEGRLRRRLERAVEHGGDALRRHRGVAGREWHHGDLPTHRPPYFDRSVEEREIVRHKSFAVSATSPEEAVLDLELLDHDFFLFTSAGTGESNVVHRVAGGCYALIQPTPQPAGTPIAIGIEASPLVPSVMEVEEAVALLDLGDEPFVFFLDPETGRGRVVYRRYDGHYGLITPASP